MTREQIDAIRARVEAATPGPWSAWRSNSPSIDEGWGLTGVTTFADAQLCANAPTDLRALLAEVERLTSVCARYRDELSSSHDDFDEARKQVNELSDKVERLTADPLPAAAWVREVERAAYQRGVAAMREAARTSFVNKAKKWQSEGDEEMELRYLRLAGEIRALPDPEDTP